MHKISVLCVKFGTMYHTDYVIKLRNMVARHLTVPYEFVCLTDDETPIDGVRLIVQPNGGYTRGWWHKVHMFDPTLSLEGIILYFDLDVVIHDNIDKLVATDCQFLGIRDFNRKFNKHYHSLNSSVLSWVRGEHHVIWDKFKKSPTDAARFIGDQDWIWGLEKANIIFWPDEWIQSYKWEVRDRSELAIVDGKRNFSDILDNPRIPTGCCVSVFHGDPKPHMVQDKFVLENWK